MVTVTAAAPLSFRGFARLIGCAHSAVSKAARSGRLRDSLGLDAHGRRCIVDVDLAKREWRDGAGKLPNGPQVRDDGGSCEDLFFALFAYVVHEHARSTATKWRGSCPVEVDLAALRAWLAERGYR